MGALIKNVYAPRTLHRDPADVVSVSVMPCTAKKGEAHRPQDRQQTYSEKLDATVRCADWLLLDWLDGGRCGWACRSVR